MAHLALYNTTHEVRDWGSLDFRYPVSDHWSMVQVYSKRDENS